MPQVTGLFTNEDIESGEFITWYTGEAYSDQLNSYNEELASLNISERDLTYGFTIHANCTLEAHSHGNLMRFANHTAKEFQNCKVEVLFSDEMTHYSCLISCRKIKKGSELVFDYDF